MCGRNLIPPGASERARQDFAFRGRELSAMAALTRGYFGARETTIFSKRGSPWSDSQKGSNLSDP